MSNNEDKFIERLAVAADELPINNISEVNEDAKCTPNDYKGSEDLVSKLVKKLPDTVNYAECTANKFKESENSVKAEKKLVDEFTRIEVSNSNVTKEDTCENKNLRILQKASDKLHSPFYWQADLHIKTYGDHEIDFLTEFEEMFEETSFSFRRFIVNLVMCYHNFYQCSLEKSMKNLEEIEKMLYYSARKESVDPLFSTIKDALFHISHSCRVYILEMRNEIQQACQILEKIKPYISLDNSNKAGIWGVRAAVYAEYGYEGIKTAIEYATKAIELDNKNAFWYFFKGIYLGRLRRMEKSPTIPEQEEIKCLETACATRIRKDPAFYTFTAEVYLEIVKVIEKKGKLKKQPMDTLKKQKLSQHLATYTAKAKKYFEESLKIKKNCAHLLFRCGKGLMRMPPPYQDLKMAKTLLKQGLEMSPTSSFGNHAMAIFIMKHEKDSEAAEQYLNKCIVRRNFQAHMDLCRMRYLEGENSEFLVSELNKMLDWYKGGPKRCKIYGELICCYLFTAYDLVKACNCAKNLIELHTTWNDYIYEFNSRIFPFSNNIPLIELIVSEIGGRFYHKDITDIEKNAYKKFHDFILLENVQLPKDTPKNILRTYLDDLKQGLLRQRQFVAVKSCSKNKESQLREKYRGTHLRSSSDKKYGKYYTSHRDVLRSSSPSSAESDRGRGQNRSRQKGRDHHISADQSKRSRRNRSREREHNGLHGRKNRFKSSSKSSVSSRENERTEHLTEGMSAFAIDENKNKCKQMKSSVPTYEISLTEKCEAFLLNSKEINCEISYSTEKEPQMNVGSEKMSVKSSRSASSNRKSALSNRCKEKYRNISLERKSTRSNPIRRDHDSNSPRGPKNKSKRSYKHRDYSEESRRSRKCSHSRDHNRSTSSSAESDYRPRYRNCRSRRRSLEERSLHELSYSSDRSRRSYKNRERSNSTDKSKDYGDKKSYKSDRRRKSRERSYSSDTSKRHRRERSHITDRSKNYGDKKSYKFDRRRKSRERSYSSDMSKRHRRERSHNTDRSKNYGDKKSYKSDRRRKSRERSYSSDTSKRHRHERSYSGERSVRDHDEKKNCESNRSGRFHEHDDSFERNDRKEHSRRRRDYSDTDSSKNCGSTVAVLVCITNKPIPNHERDMEPRSLPMSTNYQTRSLQMRGSRVRGHGGGRGYRKDWTKKKTTGRRK